MAERDEAQFDIGHPAPDRDRVSLWLLFFGLLAGPVAWSLQLNANAAVAGLACLTTHGAAAPAIGSESTSIRIVVVNLVALAIGLSALGVSLACLRRTRHLEHAGGVMEAGEGRSRLLSIWGIWTSVLFLLAIGANTISVFWRGLCPA